MDLTSKAVAAAYLAGMIDGEGTVQCLVGKTKTGKTRSARYVKIANTDLHLLEVCAQCCQRLGIKYRLDERAQVKEGWSQGWDLCIGNKQDLQRLYDTVPIQCVRKRERLAHLLTTYRPEHPTKEEIERLYIQEGMSYEDMMQHFGIKSAATISRLMHKYGIQPRTYSAAAAISWQERHTKKEVPPRAEVDRLYATMSIAEVAQHYGVSTSTMVNWLERLGIPKRPNGMHRKRYHHKDGETQDTLL